LKPHPARFPSEIPEFFIRMLTDPGDLVVDPFAGSCVTGEVAERLKRKWVCVEIVEDYLKGALARFHKQPTLFPLCRKKNSTTEYYKVYHPAVSWTDKDEIPLPPDGGHNRPAVSRKE
jgi:site-specific DNA-methyltransferase (cytosine-N4-specific)